MVFFQFSQFIGYDLHKRAILMAECLNACQKAPHIILISGGEKVCSVYSNESPTYFSVRMFFGNQSLNLFCERNQYVTAAKGHWCNKMCILAPVVWGMVEIVCAISYFRNHFFATKIFTMYNHFHFLTPVKC